MDPKASFETNHLADLRDEVTDILLGTVDAAGWPFRVAPTPLDEGRVPDAAVARLLAMPPMEWVEVDEDDEDDDG